MVRVIVVFESRYGNTERAAESITEGINEIGGIEVSLKELKEVDLKAIPGYDAILIGSPNHLGSPTRGIKAFIDKLGQMQLVGKKFAVFDTYMGMDVEKAVKKMEKRLGEKAPGLRRLTAGLSIKVQGIKGPVLEGELIKCKEFGKKIAAQLKNGG
ncbi:MAG: flavodoxin domain-containing protein [Candidatus Bathyarchaeia archaeon]